ncbi:MliC family protein [Sphingomonas sp. Leaf343]|uniref:MliC family protein n=1 Tax=Sphingomonas sp. Leaf343 TaxID=1736345 RepID=UPI0006F651DF|nr:MliC family protein [Sphingomonas sp. Leaf343]KQR83067.1 hypothetical protein ASG07_08795 [Sphingomonas sp. Leaf343]
MSLIGTGCTNEVEASAKTGNAIDLAAAANEAAADIGNYAAVAAVPADEQAAGDVVRGMFAALVDRRWRDARLDWRDPANMGRVERERDGYERFIAEVGRAVADRSVDAMTVPLEIVATAAGGRQMLYTGEATLQRGRSGDRAWKIERIDLSPAIPVRVDAVYRCADGRSLTVVFDNRRQTALADMGRTTWRLEQQRVASGIGYSGQGAELRGQGRDADWRVPGQPPLRCSVT